MRVELLAFAKINLALRVLRRREDGFHEIESVVQTIDLPDRITVEPGPAIRVENDLADIEGEDLAALGARKVLTKKGGPSGVRIRISKGIPAGAGLGGGSSDAAAVISAIDRLFPPPLPLGDLLSVAAEVGSDVPLFLRGGRLRLKGRGEIVEEAGPGDEGAFLVIVPPIRCRTARVYAGWRPASCPSGERGLGVNDLLLPALSICPGLIPYHRAVVRLDCLYAGMSGSGSAFYAAFSDRRSAGVAAEDLKGEFPDALFFVCAPTAEGHRIVGGGD